MVEMFRYLTGILEKEERRGWKILAVLYFLSPVMGVFSVSMILYIINIAIFEEHVSDVIIGFTVFMGVMSIVKGFFELYKCKVYNRFVYDGTQKLSVKMCELLIKEDLQSHNQKSPMQAIASVYQDTRSCMNIIVSCIEICINVFTMVVYYAIIIWGSSWIGIGSCVLFTFFIRQMFFYQRKKMKLYGEKNRACSIKANAQVTIAYGNFKEMKISDNSEITLRKFQEADREYVKVQKEYQYTKSVIDMVMQNFVMMAVFIILACMLVYPSGRINLLYSSKIIYFTILIRMIPMANSIVNRLNNVEFYKKSYEETKKALTEYEKIKENEERSESVRQKELTLHKGICIKNLSFSYNEHTEIFKDACIDVPVGCSVAVIGVSGIGKTTFLDLVLGLLKPQTGSIMYDDYDIVAQADQDGSCRASLGSIASYIPQTIYLNGESVRNNVIFYSQEKDSDDSKVEKCLRCAQVWDDVMRMPEGLDTLIGENGTFISGGQRQRIALARALYKDFEILIMDEATAALDMETEKAVLDSIRHIRGNKTLLIVTHHMSLANECDHVYKIENKKFVKVK